jgi:predicted secreted protein
MAKMRGLGTSFSYLPTYDSVAAVTVVGALTSVGEISPDSDELDVTALDSTGGYREFLQGFKDSGEVSLTGFHDATVTGQATMRTLYGSGATGYFWVTFPDQTTVAFTAYLKGYTAGSADVDGVVGFGAVLRITGLVQIITTKAAVAQAKAAGQTATMDSTATAYTGTPSYQWYTNDEENYTSMSIVAGATSATYTTGALGAGVYYYICVVTVPNYRAVNSQIHVITVA